MATQARRAMVALALVVFAAALVGCTPPGGNAARTIEPSDPLGPPPVALVAGTVFDEVTGIGIRGAVVKLSDKSARQIAAAVSASEGSICRSSSRSRFRPSSMTQSAQRLTEQSHPGRADGITGSLLVL